MSEGSSLDFTVWIWLTYEFFKSGNFLIGIGIVFVVILLLFLVIVFEVLAVVWGVSSFVIKIFKKLF